MTLTNIALKNAKPGAKPYKIAAGNGLHVLVKPTGAKLFRFKCRIHGKEKLLAIGSYPETSLVEAQERRDDARRLVRNGQDPAALKKLEKLQRKVAAATTTEDVAREWMAEKGKRQKPHHNRAELRRLEIDVFPAIGKRPLAEILPLEVLAVLRKIEERGAPEMRVKVRQLLGQAFRYGISTQKCVFDPIPSLKNAFQPHEVRPMAAIKEGELPTLLLRMDGFCGEPTTRLALFFYRAHFRANAGVNQGGMVRI
jgi:hypothetical protein